MKIRAAVVREKGKQFSIEEMDLDEPRDDEVLVRIVGAGICHTDMVARDQLYPVPHPLVCGHEGAGVVERVGAGVTKVKPGDHVVLSYVSCGTCANCRRGKPQYCFDLYQLNFGGARPDGSTTVHQNEKAIHAVFFGQSSFSTYSLAFERNVVKVREDVPLEILGPLGCGVQTGSGTVFNALCPEAGSSLAVFGAGAVGLSALMAAKTVGCLPIIAVDIKAKRLQLAQELGASHAINASEVDPVKEIKAITGGGANYSIEATGLPHVVRQAVDCLAPTGVCGLLGAAPFGAEVNLDVNTVLFGRTVRGVIEGESIPDLFIPRLIELYRGGLFPFDRLIKFYPFTEINRAVADSESGAVIKPVLRP